MPVVKSFSVGNGDTFCINHQNGSVTVIDCNLSDLTGALVANEIRDVAKGANVVRFISTHPDEDHIHGIEGLADNLVQNFYCVQNNVWKDPVTPSFKRYAELRARPGTFSLYGGMKKLWLNQSDESQGGCGLHVLWPDLNNPYFQKAKYDAENGSSPNNLSPILWYAIQGGPSFCWLGDLETDFMENISKFVTLPKTTVVFAPHHGRNSGKIPSGWLNQLSPELIVIGEAPSEHLNYYRNWNTIKQNTARDITFLTDVGRAHVFCSNPAYSEAFLSSEMAFRSEPSYIGTIRA